MCKIKKTIYFLFILFLFISCGSGINGKIEKRESKCGDIENAKKVFLVNGSTSKRLSFTIKKTETINDTTINYSTFQKELEPGDEIDLGCDKKIGEDKYKSLNVPVIIDTIIYVNNRNSQETKYYCSKDTSLFNYEFYYVFIMDDKNTIPIAEVKQYLLENKQLTIKEFLPDSKLYIGLLESAIKMDENLTKKNGKLTTILNCTDLSVKLKNDEYSYKFEVTGQIEAKAQKEQKMIK